MECSLDKDKLLSSGKSEAVLKLCSETKGIKTNASVENDDLFQKMEDAVIQQPSKLENDGGSPRKSRRNKLQRNGALVDVKNKCSEPLKVIETDIVPSKLETLRGEKICQELQESEKTDDDFSENLMMKFKTADKQEFKKANNDDNPKKKSLNYPVRNKFSDELKPSPKHKTDSPKKLPRNRFEFGRKPDLGVLKKGGKLSSSDGSSGHDSSERGELFQKLVPCPPTSDCGTQRPSTLSSSDCETQRPSTSGYKKTEPSMSFGETFMPKKNSQQLSMPQSCEFMIRDDDSEHLSDISMVQNNVDNLKSPENQGIVLDESAYKTTSEYNSSDQHDLYDVPGPSNASPYSPGTPSCSYASYDPMDINQPSTSKESEPHVRNKLSDHFRSLRPIESPSDCNEICKFRTMKGDPYKADYFECGNIKKLYVHLRVGGKKQKVVTCLKCRKKRCRKLKTVSAKFYKLGVYNLQNPDSSSSDSDNENCDPIVPRESTSSESDSDNENCDPIVPRESTSSESDSDNENCDPIVPRESTSSESGYHSHDKVAKDFKSNDYEEGSDDVVVETLNEVSMDLDTTFSAYQNPDSSASDSDNKNCDPTVPTESTSSESGYHSHDKVAKDFISNDYEEGSDDVVVETLCEISMDLDPTFSAYQNPDSSASDSDNKNCDPTVPTESISSESGYHYHDKFTKDLKSNDYEEGSDDIMAETLSHLSMDLDPTFSAYQNPDSSVSDSDNKNCDPTVPTESTSSESGYHSHDKLAKYLKSNDYEESSDDIMIETLSQLSMDLDPTFSAYKYPNFNCVHCSEKFLNEQENYDHICNGKPVKGFQCIVCEKIFSTFEQKDSHIEHIHELDLN